MNPSFATRFRVSSSLFLATAFALMLLAAHSKPAAAQTTAPNQAAPAPAVDTNASNSELESAVSLFSRREGDLPKGPAPKTTEGHPDP